MSYEQKPRVVLFPNNNEGQPIKKKDGTFVTKSNGDQIMHGAFNGKINLPEGLTAGDYDFSVYRGISKTGNEYLAGNIKPAYVKKDVDSHNEAKSNGYAPQSNLVEEDSDDSIPF